MVSPNSYVEVDKQRTQTHTVRRRFNVKEERTVKTSTFEIREDCESKKREKDLYFCYMFIVLFFVSFCLIVLSSVDLH